MKKIISFIGIFILLAGIPLSAFAKTVSNEIPRDVQQYAEETAFPEFRIISPELGFQESLDLSSLTLGEGFPVCLIRNDPSVNTLETLIESPHKWLYFVKTGSGETVGDIIISRSQEGLSSSGGGQTAYASDSVAKMRELIRNYGEQGDPLFIEYSIRGQLLFYSFGGDERVLDLSAVLFGEINLDEIVDYRQLPTAQEMLKSLREINDSIHREMENNGGEVLYGGVDLNLSLHDLKQPTVSPVILPVLAPVLILAAFLLWGRRNHPLKR